jgi:hypothetical protein
MFKKRSAARLTLLAPIALAVTACVQSPPIFAEIPDCSSLVPQGWRDGVGHAAKPAVAAAPRDDSLAEQLRHATDSLKAWIGFGAAEAGQVEKADDRLTSALGIIERCEARDAAAIRRSKPKRFGIF